MALSVFPLAKPLSHQGMFTLDYIHHNPTSSQCKNPTLPPSVQKWDHMRGLNLPFEFYQEMQLYLHLQVDRTLRTALCIVVIWWTNTNNGKWIEQASLSPFLSLAVSRTFCKIIFSPMKVQSMRYVNLNHKESTIKMGLFMIKWRKYDISKYSVYFIDKFVEAVEWLLPPAGLFIYIDLIRI